MAPSYPASSMSNSKPTKVAGILSSSRRGLSDYPPCALSCHILGNMDTTWFSGSTTCSPLLLVSYTVLRSLCTSPSELKPLKRKNHELIDGISTRNLFVFRQRTFLPSLWVEAGTILVALSKLISEYNGETHWMLLNGILSVGIYWSVPLAPKRDP